MRAVLAALARAREPGARAALRHGSQRLEPDAEPDADAAARRRAWRDDGRGRRVPEDRTRCDRRRRHVVALAITAARAERVYFDANCSHEAASQHLGVHRKTIAHRLAKIGELTGLDLSTHDDRLVADLSLYVYRMLQGWDGQGN
jgi:PucR C-terminal helix-turn-helix domain